MDVGNFVFILVTTLNKTYCFNRLSNVLFDIYKNYRRDRQTERGGVGVKVEEGETQED